MAGITLNPALVTNAPGTFAVSSDGFVQGTMEDDPVTRFALASGIVSTSATSPMWGGVGITDSLANPSTVSQSLRSVLALATSQANLTGFTVFNQATAMIQTPQSPVPLAAAGMGINFFRLGSGARICVACSNNVAAALEGGASNQVLYWDYTNQVLLNAPGGTAINVKVIDVNVGNSQIVTYSSGTGFATWTRNGSCAVIQI